MSWSALTVNHVPSVRVHLTRMRASPVLCETNRPSEPVAVTVTRCVTLEAARESRSCHVPVVQSQTLSACVHEAVTLPAYVTDSLAGDVGSVKRPHQPTN